MANVEAVQGLPGAGRLCWTYKETAMAAGISKAMVRKLVKDKKLEAISIGRARRVPRHAVLKLCGAK